MIVENVILTMTIVISGVEYCLIVLNIIGGCHGLVAQYESCSKFIASDRRAVEMIRRG